LEPTRIWQRHRRGESVESSGLPPERIGLAATFTIEPLVPHLGGELLQRRLSRPEFLIAPFNQLHQLCLDPEAALGGSAEVLVILWRLEDLLPGQLEAALSSEGEEPAAEKVLKELDALIASVTALRGRFQGALVLGMPPYPFCASWAPQLPQQATAATSLFNSIRRRWLDGVGGMDRVMWLDLQALLMEHGHARAHDPRKWYLYRQPYTEAFWSEVAGQTARLLSATRVAAKKCVVVDCDNTLWGGVVGEDLLAGLELGEEFPGRAYRDFQRGLLQLRRQGVLLAVASKNEAADVAEVFDHHDAMVLRRDDISVFQVHWNPKSQSLRAIAEILNIGTDSLVLIDDSPVEIAEVQTSLPEVICLQVPEDVAYLPGLLRDTTLFDSVGRTVEDDRRVEMMQAEGRRREVQASLSREEFLLSLDLEVSIFVAREPQLTRVGQLVNKTNQFNLTTVRRTRDELANLLLRPGWRVLAMDVTDRFGEYGLVGVAILRDQGDGTWVIDTLLMSCRVLGRGVEQALLAGVADCARQAGVETLRGSYVASSRNGLVADYYPERGFEPEVADAGADEAWWRCLVADVAPAPGHVQLELPGEWD
jgi:FkbH-like protein